MFISPPRVLCNPLLLESIRPHAVLFYFCLLYPELPRVYAVLETACPPGIEAFMVGTTELFVWDVSGFCGVSPCWTL